MGSALRGFVMYASGCTVRSAAGAQTWSAVLGFA